MFWKVSLEDIIIEVRTDEDVCVRGKLLHCNYAVLEVTEAISRVDDVVCLRGDWVPGV